ncbi:MAG: molybdopterin-dependent oxidoreductase, partial [Alphaproteobacteria bacterium]|nr:molybdopterin-dependent oxidoreductase [Alphaproteobacteria bacterium]
MTENGIGARVPRTEDKRFITGHGRYTDDIDLPGQAYAVFVRSPVAHARIKSLDTSAAKAAPGVIGVLTGEDVAADGIGGLICGWMVKSKDGSDMKAGAHPIIAKDKVRYVGDQVAVVVARTYAEARDAADLVEVDYAELPAVVDLATAPDGATVHDEIARNTVYEWELGDQAATEQALSSAAHVTEIEITNNRLVPNAMEPRAAIGQYDPATDHHTLFTTSQNPHVARLVMSAFVGLAPEHKFRVVAPDVGGGFGSKIFIYAEECVCLWAARRLRVPVKWTAERSESFLTDAHGRDHVTTAKLALDADGNFTGLKVHTTANMGAYLSTFASSIPTYLYATLLAGQYKTPAIHCEVDALYTNTAPVDAYRGAGRPEATYLVETLVEQAARETGRDPAELRRRNFIQPDQFPYQTPVALTYDTGNYEAHLDAALELADYKGFPQRKAEAQARGKLRGIGFSCYIEACGIAPSQVVGALGAGVGLWEAGKVRFSVTGKLQVFTGSHSHGQGHETTFAQVMASKLGVPYGDIEIVHGDTDQTPMGMGTYGSRSLAVGGSALVKAAEKVI